MKFWPAVKGRQPLVVEPGVYVLTSSIAGIVEKSKVIDGSAIAEGDAVLAIASNGLHFRWWNRRESMQSNSGGIKCKLNGSMIVTRLEE